jgi:hypothetical protein
MKILHIINNLEIGGAEKLLTEILPKINNYANIEASLYLLNSKDTSLKLNLIENKVKILGDNKKGFLNIKNLVKLLRVVKKYDVIHIHLFPAQYLILILKIIFPNKKYVTTEHSTHNRRRNIKLLRLLEKLVYSLYDKVICISEATKLNLIQWIKSQNNNKYIIINNGVDINKFKNGNAYDKSLFFSKEDKIVCMVGRLTEQKDQATIIKAMNELPENIKLLLVGEGIKRGYLENMVKNYNLEKRIKFLGNRDDIPNILKTIDISIISSNWEGFGLVAVEGMAAGKPIIASNVEGLKEVVSGAGLLFEKGNHKELANLIKKLLENEAYYKEVLNKCIKRAKKYDIDVMVEKYLEVYQEMLKE